MSLLRQLAPHVSAASHSCYRPTLSRYSGRHGRATHGAISQRSHTLDALQCHIPAELQQLHDSMLK